MSCKLLWFYSNLRKQLPFLPNRLQTYLAFVVLLRSYGNSHKSYFSQFPWKPATKGGGFLVIEYATLSGISPIREDFQPGRCCENWITHLAAFHSWSLGRFSRYCLWLSTLQTLFLPHSSNISGHAYASMRLQALNLRTMIVTECSRKPALLWDGWREQKHMWKWLWPHTKTSSGALRSPGLDEGRLSPWLAVHPSIARG